MCIRTLLTGSKKKSCPKLWIRTLLIGGQLDWVKKKKSCPKLCTGHSMGKQHQDRPELVKTTKCPN